ncbi:hypothetical protein [Heyndrickxia ginsengihumi]|uniref:hypothetical protein n=1 Tax=Heyndrickxia ginsengihumi TaxID=363870 RepID=UPI003D1B9912
MNNIEAIKDEIVEGFKNLAEAGQLMEDLALNDKDELLGLTVMATELVAQKVDKLLGEVYGRQDAFVHIVELGQRVKTATEGQEKYLALTIAVVDFKQGGLI